jgi:hypothetical protein
VPDDALDHRGAPGSEQAVGVIHGRIHPHLWSAPRSSASRHLIL